MASSHLLKTGGGVRVATKILRNEIPQYFVLFLFCIFAKILGKFPRNFEEFRFAKGGGDGKGVKGVGAQFFLPPHHRYGGGGFLV